MATKSMYTAPGIRKDKDDKCYGFTLRTNSPVYLRDFELRDFIEFLEPNPHRTIVRSLNQKECTKFSEYVLGFADALENLFGIKHPNRGLVVWAISSTKLSSYLKEENLEPRILLMCQDLDINSKLVSTKDLLTLEDYLNERKSLLNTVSEEDIDSLSRELTGKPISRRKSR